MPASDWAMSLLLDLDLDGTYEQDESAYLRAWESDEGVKTALDEIGPSTLKLTLKNSDARYSPDKAVLSGFGLGTPVRLGAQWTEAAVTNIDENPSAETDTTGSAVFVSGTITQATDEAWVGGACFKFVGSDDGAGIAKQKRAGTRFDVTAGLDYTWAPRVKGTADKAMKIQIRWYNSGGSLIQTDEAEFTFGSGWVQPVLTAEAPVGAVTCYTGVVLDGAGATTFYSDANFFYQGSSLVPYCDGDQPGCSWSGTAHQSTSSRSANPTFPIFSGIVYDIDGQEDGQNTEAVVSCIDPMAGLPQHEIKLGNMYGRTVAEILHRIADQIEGEQMTQGGFESLDYDLALTGMDWSAVGSATLARYWIVAGASRDTQIYEGDSCMQVTPDGGTAQSGARYDATTDVPDITTARTVVVYAVGASAVDVRVRFYKDAAVIATTTVSLTTAYQRIELAVPAQGSNGTNHYIEIVTDTAVATVFYVDCVHVVATSKVITRTFDTGQAALPLVNAYVERADVLMKEIAASEPGRVYFRATAGPGELVFKDRDARSATAIPRASLGDGDGLLPFGNRLQWALEGDDLVDTVIIRSRGTPVERDTATIWELSPVRDTTTDEVFGAKYNQVGKRVIVLKETNVSIEYKEANYGIGADIEVTTGGSDSYIALQGYAFEYPLEESFVRYEAATPLSIPRPPMQIDMPWQDTASSDMTDEAERLGDKYSAHVWRLAVPLSFADEENEALLFDLALGDLLLIEADNQDHSPGIRENFWVEGIRREWRVGEVPKATAYLEEQ